MRPCEKASVLEKQERVNVRRKMLENTAINLKADWFFELDCEVVGAKIRF
jgi:hypothetical protein